MNKRPKGHPQRGKEPKVAKAQSNPSEIGDPRPLFSFGLIDRDQSTKFGWHLMTEGCRRKFVDFLADISLSTWKEIRAQKVDGRLKYHGMEFGDLSPDAQTRIRALRSAERFNDIRRFRLGNKERLWGFEENGVFHVLWWDPQHAVYPTE